MTGPHSEDCRCPTCLYIFSTRGPATGWSETAAARARLSGSASRSAPSTCTPGNGASRTMPKDITMTWGLGVCCLFLAPCWHYPSHGGTKR